MRFGKQNNYKEWMYSKPVIGILLLVALLFSSSVYERFTVERDMANRRNLSEQELQMKKERKIELEERVEYLEGQRGIEEEIRKNFDVAKQGEQVIILTGSEGADKTTKQEVPDVVPWYQFWR